eukprot:TRINITY_DN83369_c0_g1_i1.p2 TRINITY_DN83369_c0_g1~~TRINITY_DN83369_c0_g1_i1.p2  ORF type:complete len:134 (-),score=7.54 TRINITY_DN83369_c0_g1_i1:375-737(-)
MVYRRLPTWFPNFPLRLLPLTEEEFLQLKTTGWLRLVKFMTKPDMNKIELKQFLRRVYSLKIEKLQTANVMGKKVRSMKSGKWYKKPDWKKVYVWLRPPYDFTDYDELEQKEKEKIKLEP